jgi:peroxiredoxin
LACRSRPGKNEALGIRARNATANRLIVDSVDHGIRQQYPGLVIGDQAPPLKLPNIEGAVVSLESYLGSETLVLFWNPHCGFCNNMLRELKAWEANIPAGAPKLLVVSTGSVEDNRATGLSSPVVLDSSFSARAAFGVNGTPSAVLVDSEGKIASEVAVGAYAVLKLTHGGSAA